MPDEISIARWDSCDLAEISREVLGYLNFSSGASDPVFLRRLTQLGDWAVGSAAGESNRSTSQLAKQESGQAEHQPPEQWRTVRDLLRQKLDELQASPPPGKETVYRDCEQAKRVLGLTIDGLLPAYRDFHPDLLQHLSDAELFNGFFVGRAFEAVLAQGAPWTDEERIIGGAIRQLNDFVGHRPVAILDGERRTDPYSHEWTRPIPLYVRDAGVTPGPHAEIVLKALQFLQETEPALCEIAEFSLERMDELAYDGRAYDFDHPANKRLNYQFGQWDPHLIDNSGRYRRFVLTDVTLRALNVARSDDGELDESQLTESAAVLACVLLMASGVSGAGPDAHDSTVSLATLVSRIATYRDEFYAELLARTPEPHGEKLRAEARVRRQPFGAIRQELNQRLARLRAEQQQQVFLARLFARMGFFEASHRQSSGIHVASARIQCEIDCQLAAGQLALQRGQREAAHRHAKFALGLLQRGIDCGAIVDPWSILGFGGHFSLFPAMENTVRDHRIYQLVHTTEAIFGLWGRLEGVAAAMGDTVLREEIHGELVKLSDWWDQFASVEVSDVAGFSGAESTRSAEHVANSLADWHQAGASAGDIKFWAERIDGFNTAKAYALVVNSLLQQGDLDASQSLLMHWLSRGDSVLLKQGDYSFHRLARRWLQTAIATSENPFANNVGDVGSTSQDSADKSCCKRVVKFLEFLEANADEHGQVPKFGWQASDTGDVSEFDDLFDEQLSNEDAAEHDEHDDIFAAAYEDVSFIDSSDDGMAGPIFDPHEDRDTQFEWEEEAKRIGRRLAFFKTCADLWTTAADHRGFAAEAGLDRLQEWCEQLGRKRTGLQRLLAELHRRDIKPPRCEAEALIEFDRKQRVRESLLESTIETSVSIVLALLRLRALSAESSDPSVEDQDSNSSQKEVAFPWEQAAVKAWREAGRQDRPHEDARTAVASLMEQLLNEPLLYVPSIRGGNPWKIVSARALQNLLIDFARLLPRWGLVYEACHLVETARLMEVTHPQGQHAVSEFDRLFRTAFAALVECVIRAARQDPQDVTESELLESLNTLAERLLGPWLAHSASLRLSVAETFLEDRPWKELVKFIHNYGRELFVPRFFNEGNLRAILHQGTEEYLSNWIEEHLDDDDQLVVDIANETTSLQVAATWLQVIVQAILENSVEYKDYNYTTTQSDHGDQLDTFLDFLRLKAGYERINWNLSPLVIAHDVLVRQGEHGAAELWTQGVAEQTATAADHYLDQYEKLVQKHGMRLRTIRDLLEEHFVRPLRVSKALALIEPAVKELRHGRQDGVAATALEHAVDDLAAEPTGVGLDLPDWLLELAGELENVDELVREDRLDQSSADTWVPLSPENIVEQLDRWTQEYED
ncbi:MAG: hypothetical protein MPJ50_14185 [Pirellulales bacterium]|nr:hypothetical protein [Pirellulales bacterium]